MKNEDKTKEQLIRELEELRRRLAELEEEKETLLESENRYRTIFETTAAANIIIEEDMTISLVNRQCEKLSGYSKEEIEGKKRWTEFVASSDLERMKEYHRLRRVDPDAAPMQYEFRLVDRSGNVKDILVNVGLIPGTKRSVASLIDITERKRAEEEIRKFKTIADQAPYGVTISNIEGELVYVNKTYAEMHGYSPDELIGRHCSVLYTEEQMKTVQKLRNRLLQEGNFPGEEVWHKRRDGTVFPTLMSAHLVRDESGNPLYLTASVLDITERRKMEEALRHSEERFRELAELLPETVFETDREGKLTFANRNALEVFGYSQKDIDDGLYSFQMLVPEDRERARENLQKILNSEGMLGGIEYTALRKDGSTFPAIIYSSPIIRENEVTGTRGILTDVSAHKKIQEQLILTDRLASLGELASGIAHELNNPLTSIIGFSELLLSKDVPDHVKEDLKVINKEALRTAGIVKNLLAFARKHPETKEPVNINDVIQQVLELRSYEQKVHNIEVDAQLAPDLPKVMANAFQLQQVFLNIIINAEYFMIEAHGKGLLTITTERMGNMVWATFTDDGPGIAKENLQRVFNPFFTTKEVGKGTGLGLSICHGIVTEHGGRIYVESELGKGATFIVELPATSSDEEEGGR